MTAWRHGPALVSKPLGENCRAIVILPARDEERFITRALQALVTQIDLTGHAIASGSYEIIILLNNCTDGSRRLVETFITTNARVPIHIVEVELPSINANIGHVRRLLMDEACRRLLEAGRRDGAVLSTDADSVVSPTWVEQSRRMLSSGLDAVGGRIVLDPFERKALPKQVRRGHELDIAYNLLRAELEATLDPDEFDPWPRHHQHFAANLGVTADAYQRVGGIPSVSHLEDVALWEALRMDNAKLRHSPDILVRTSARMEGRVSVGLSEHLRGFNRNDELQVESAALLSHRFRARGFLHQAWRSYQAENGRDARADANIRQAATLAGLNHLILRDALEAESSWSDVLRTSDLDAGIARNGAVELCLEPLSEAVQTLKATLIVIRQGSAG